MIVIELPGEPRGKGRPRFNRKSGAAYTPATTQSFEGALKLAGVQAMKAAPPLAGALNVTIEAYFPIRASWPKRKQEQALRGDLRPTGKPDFDNLAKMVDALNQVVWIDDSQVVEAVIRKFYSARPRLVVRVAPSEPPDIFA